MTPSNHGQSLLSCGGAAQSQPDLGLCGADELIGKSEMEKGQRPTCSSREFLLSCVFHRFELCFSLISLLSYTENATKDEAGN